MKKIFILIVIVICAGLFVFYYINKAKPSLVEMKPMYTVTADEIFNDFDKDESAANKKYVDKVVEVSGVVQSFNKKSNTDRSIIFQTSSGMFGVICKIDSTYNPSFTVDKGANLKIKGVCTGMLMDIILVRCIPIQ
jgi:hypothetical protein